MKAFVLGIVVTIVAACGYSLSLLRNGDGPRCYFGVADGAREEIRSYSRARASASRAVCQGVAREGADRCPAKVNARARRTPQRQGVTEDEPGPDVLGRPQTESSLGMPGFHQGLFTAQMWQVSLLLARADKLPESVKNILASPNVVSPREVVSAKYRACRSGSGEQR
jgi:hypothetical protein